MSEKEKVFISQYAENVHFGKPCGLLDQSAIAFGGLTLLDFRKKGDVEPRHIECDLDEYTLVLVDTGGDHKHLTGEYASITDEMGAVSAYFGKERLIEVDEDEFYAARDRKEVSARRRKPRSRWGICGDNAQRSAKRLCGRVCKQNVKNLRKGESIAVKSPQGRYDGALKNHYGKTH